MLREGRTLRELQAIADRVYGVPSGTSGAIYVRQHARLLTLGTLKRRPWGEKDPAKVEEIWRVTREVLTPAASDGVERAARGGADA